MNSQVCGPRGCGRSALCRALCIDVTRHLGTFSVIVHCRLLAREAIPSTLVWRAFAAAFDAAEANAPALLVLEDLDVLCFSGEEVGGGPTVAEARGGAIAAYLLDLITRVSHGVGGMGPCGLEWSRESSMEGFARRVLTLATVVDASSLHPLLSQPSLFGSSKLRVHCDTSTVGARLQLLRALLKFALARSVVTSVDGASPLLRDSPLDNGLPLLLDDALMTDEGDFWEIANQLEGYSLADLQAVVTRAVGESLLGFPRDSSRNVKPSAVIHASHFCKALKDVVPRATESHSFIQPDLRYSHVGGLHTPKEELYDLLTLQRTYPSLVNAAGISMHQGIILVGPPGCGKTHLAVAAVGEAGIRCIHVKGPELLGKFIGSSEAAVRDVFQKARAAKPCAILFDEIEALATKRGGDTTGVTDRVVNQLLCYLDGIEAREGVFVIATTSRPDLVDSALLRPGRFEKVCFCGLPISIVEKTEILAVALQSLNCRIAFDVDTVGPSVPWTFTPADIQAAVNQAQLFAIRETLASTASEWSVSDSEQVTITEEQVMNALHSFKPSLSLQELQRYHRHCLPYLNKTYRGRIESIEHLIVSHISQKSLFDDSICPGKERGSKLSTESPEALSNCRRYRKHGSDLLEKDSSSSNSYDSIGFEPSLISVSPLKAHRTHLHPKDFSTCISDGGSAESTSPQTIDNAPKHDADTKNCSNAPSDPKKAQRLKKSLLQLAGSRVALA
ncbi:peroxisome biogenesis factor 1, putative [Eimeria tenella]|uniref:Peroxisome biogenesis factor 1, putative n=1 Tax=Eimeria tenella TaxID=5802 RepID=U6KRR0_EIMTE|nr:peroxisome biogenesis factor 1, putative [Eimeria tenella]CDJ39034.1 peroxisome biogenesis factor 1, putative [Eimeria tenella]|eukprot:XP_013229789.1 peroxisome biogenesis factor 1, putative [Eimeria tenella]